ncbi:hypothetical protein [Lucifera butyrica]|uniref:hypothetical protein n=1 Tax=Lucifera butyrica TaxID=1351585 RepID=UPI000F02F29D|nr:hypothetical protein [Lucifera butyrica]
MSQEPKDRVSGFYYNVYRYIDTEVYMDAYKMRKPCPGQAVLKTENREIAQYSPAGSAKQTILAIGMSFALLTIVD